MRGQESENARSCAHHLGTLGLCIWKRGLVAGNGSMKPVVILMSLRPMPLCCFLCMEGRGYPCWLCLMMPRVSPSLRLLVLPSLSTFRGARPLFGLDLGSFGNGLFPEGNSEVTPQPTSNLSQASGPCGPGLWLTGWL